MKDLNVLWMAISLGGYFLCGMITLAFSLAVGKFKRSRNPFKPYVFVLLTILFWPFAVIIFSRGIPWSGIGK